MMLHTISIIHEHRANDFTYFHDGYPVIEIGRFTYSGKISLINYDSPPPLLRIGRYCSIAYEVNFVQTRDHPLDFITTYPMPHHFSNTFPDEWWNQSLEKSNSLNSIERTQIVVGSDVWIGRSATILSGVTIGDGAVVGANAVVAKNVPPYSIVVGNPAKVIKFRFDNTQVDELLKIRWWEWEHDRIVKSQKDFMSPDVAHFIKKFKGI